MLEYQPRSPSTSRPHARIGSTLAAGLVGGVCLGIAARAWMRLISEEPEFTWTGTLSIIGGFGVFGLTQAAVVSARRRAIRRRNLTTVRLIGILGMLPLFGAAGAIMFPTVVGAGLGLARDDWRRPVRYLCWIIATGPVIFVVTDVSNSFGWSPRTASGTAAMLAIYGIVIWATRATLAPQGDGWRVPRWAKTVLPVLLCLLIAIPLYLGGIS